MKSKNAAAANSLRAWSRPAASPAAVAHPPLVPSMEAAAGLERSRLHKMRLRRRRMSLSAVIDPCVEMMGPYIRGRGLNLSVATSGGDIQVEVDAARLCEVLKHLILNAARFSAGGADIVLRVERKDAHASIIVEDSGIGIDATRFDTMFAPYLERHATAPSRSGELGLGLHVARKLVEAHDGTLEATSKGTGLGSEFTLRIPCAPDQPRPSNRSVSALTAE